MRTLVQWIVSPESLIRWLKRYQQRRANSTAEDSEKKEGKEKRPWIGAEKVAAILRIYDSGLDGLSRIVGEMDKCGHKVVESTVRRVLTANGRPPVDGNHRRGSTLGAILESACTVSGWCGFHADPGRHHGQDCQCVCLLCD